MCCASLIDATLKKSIKSRNFGCFMCTFNGSRWLFYLLGFRRNIIAPIHKIGNIFPTGFLRGNNSSVNHLYSYASFTTSFSERRSLCPCILLCPEKMITSISLHQKGFDVFTVFCVGNRFIDFGNLEFCSQLFNLFIQLGMN